MKMKCRRKTPSSPSSFPTSIITHLCPISWLSKFKQKVGNLETNNNPAKKKQRSKLDFPTPSSSLPACWREARFYSVDDDDDDAYWRLSFSDCRRSACGVNTLWYDSDDEFQVPFSSYESLSKVPKENQRFNEMISDMKKVKEIQHKKRILLVKKNVNERHSRKPRCRVVRKKEGEKLLEDEKVKIKRGKAEFQGRKMKQNQGRAYSSKTECRIRVLEDMKKAKMKMKKSKSKKTARQKMRGRTIFDSFAVVKNSFNPQQDFRDSMVEMIREKGIRWREELEELLAAYLTLNCDEYHDLIIKVFQQVWFELNREVCES